MMKKYLRQPSIDFLFHIIHKYVMSKGNTLSSGNLKKSRATLRIQQKQLQSKQNKRAKKK
jgi:hypothetical protein